MENHAQHLKFSKKIKHQTINQFLNTYKIPDRKYGPEDGMLYLK